jgi:hypothetical protein
VRSAQENTAAAPTDRQPPASQRRAIGIARPDVTILAGADHAEALRQLAHMLSAENDTGRTRSAGSADPKPLPASAASGSLPMRPAADPAPDRDAGHRPDIAVKPAA